MGISDKEHYELMEQFEKDCKHLPYRSLRFDRDSKEYWPKGQFYQHGDTNSAFLACRLGYSFGRAVERLEG